MLLFRSVSLCLVAALAGLPLAPVEHVHRTDGPGGQVVAHAHLEDHQHPAEADDDHPATHVEDDDSVVVTLDRVFVSRPVHHLLELSVEADHYPPPPAAVRIGVPAQYLQRLIHGPPRAPTSLRGPPTTPAV